MHAFLLDMLECPKCHGKLNWTITERDSDTIEEAEARCGNCATIYPVREGIGIFLTADLPRNDLWEQVDSGLTRYLSEKLHLRQRLMDVPVETLAPADQFFRAMALEGYGDYAEAKRIADLAGPHLYTTEYTECYHRQRDYIVEQVSRLEGPIYDLASGRCDLAIVLAQKLDRPIIASDFSLRVMRTSRKRLKFLNLYEHFSLLVYDARLTPFKDSVIGTMTTNLGLPNIGESEVVLRELRRVVRGTLLALSHFYPIDDDANGKAIREFGLAAGLYRESALADFKAAGWQVALANTCTGKASPTPHSMVLEGMGIDGLPIENTVLEWGVLVAQ